MRKTSHSAALAFALLLPTAAPLTGCTPPVVSLKSDAEPPKTSFSSTMTRWTREGRVLGIRDFDTMLLVSATLRSRAFQHAYVDRYLDLYRIGDPKEKERITLEEMGIAESGLSFWVRTGSHVDRWNDLLQPHELWRIMLVDEQGVETLPDNVVLVNKRQTVETALFDYQPNTQLKVWQIHFPPQRSDGQPLWGEQTKKIILRFAGAPGHTDLVWALQ